MNRASLSSAVLLFLAACGGKVVIDSASGGTSGEGGATSGDSGVGGAVGTSGGVESSVVTTSGASASVTVGAGGSSPGCTGGYFDLVVDGTVVPLDFGCAADTPQEPVPFAQVFEGGPPPGGEELTIEGCATPADPSQGVRIGVTQERTQQATTRLPPWCTPTPRAHIGASPDRLR